MKHDVLLWFFKLGCVESLLWSLSELVAINAPIENEPVQAVLRMNRKPILFPYPWIFQPLSLPRHLSFLPTSPRLPPSHHIPFIPSQELSRALHVQPHRALRHMAKGRWKAQHCKKMESSTLEEREKEKERGAFHPKSRNKRKKVNSFPFLHFFKVSVFFSFFFYLKRRHQYLLLSNFCFLPTSPSYLFMCYYCSERNNDNKLSLHSSLCLKRRRRQGHLTITIIAFFFSSVAVKKKTRAMHRHLLMWRWCCKEEESDGSCCHFLLLWRVSKKRRRWRH